ncbi:hypothetical protein OG21DRAFT_1421617, partial [Imleria badia]
MSLTRAFLSSGLPCNENGNFLPQGSPPLPYSDKASDDWTPFNNRSEFELADLLYMHVQMSGGNINKLMDIFTAYLHKYNGQPPFSSHAELYGIIDSLQVGNIGWESFGVKYSSDRINCPAPWMDNIYNIWMRDPEIAITQIL